MSRATRQLGALIGVLWIVVILGYVLPDAEDSLTVAAFLLGAAVGLLTLGIFFFDGDERWDRHLRWLWIVSFVAAVLLLAFSEREL